MRIIKHNCLSLQSLSIRGQSISNFDSGSLNGMLKLKTLDLDIPLTDKELQSAPDLRNLECLRLQNSLVTDQGMDSIAKQFPNLRFLWLSGLKITNKGMKFLNELAGLEHLSITNICLDEEGVLCLSSFPKLKYLCLDSTHIGERTIEYFRRLPSLETLSLKGNQVTRTMLLQLIAIRTLKELDVRDTTIDIGILRELASDWGPKYPHPCCDHRLLCRRLNHDNGGDLPAEDANLIPRK
jgi:Leucine-rich repeat (LRR) protein